MNSCDKDIIKHQKWSTIFEVDNNGAFPICFCLLSQKFLQSVR